MDYFGVKELYGVTLKCTSNMEINGEYFERNEPLISFDKIQIAYLNEQKRRTSARGGYHNQTLVNWEDTTGMSIQLSEGVISKTGLALISNSGILREEEAVIIIPYSETLESDKEDGKWVLNVRYPIEQSLYIRRNGQKITDFDWQQQTKKITINNVQDDAEIEPPIYTVYYDYIYNGDANNMCIGQKLVKGFLTLTGRMRLKDDQSGKETTCLIEIPKVQLMSDLTMRLGSEVSPYVYGFNLQAHPVGERGNQYVCKFTMLDRDIDSDI